jgi:hypothetical protein
VYIIYIEIERTATMGYILFNVVTMLLTVLGAWGLVKNFMLGGESAATGTAAALTLLVWFVAFPHIIAGSDSLLFYAGHGAAVVIGVLLAPRSQTSVEQ